MVEEHLADRLAALVAMSSGDVRLDTRIRLTCARALSLHPLPVEEDLHDGSDDRERVVAAFAEQFAVDVTGIGENQRTQFVSALGKNAFRVATAIFIADFRAAGVGGVRRAAHGQAWRWRCGRLGPRERSDRRPVERIRPRGKRACGRWIR